MSKTYKVLLLGDIGVGKSTLFNSLSRQEKNVSVKPAIKAKIIKIKRTFKGEEITIELYDLGGREFLTPKRSKWYFGTIGAIIVFDVSKPDTFRHVPFWMDELLNYNNFGIVPIVLVGNKSDLRESAERTLNPIDAQQYIYRLNRSTQRENVDNEYIEISARDGRGLTQILDALVPNIVKFENSKAK